MNLKRIAFIAAAALALASCATTEERPTSNQARSIHFAELDKNGDGVLTPDELPANLILALDFPRYDLNGDGVVNRHEFNEYVMSDDVDDD